MNKNDLQEYSAILLICFALVSGLYAFTKYIDRKADNHYAKVYQVSGKEK